MTPVGDVLVVCGIEREASIANPFTQGAHILSGGNITKLREALEWTRANKATSAVMSFGLAGGLDPELKVGDLICARAVHDGEKLYPTDPQWLAHIVANTGAKAVDYVLGSDVLASTSKMKAEMFRRTGAATVDMESHQVAKWASALQTPTAVLRVVSDDARHALPSCAVAGMGADGEVDVGAVLRALARQPWQLPALIRTGLHVEAALRRLKASAQAAGPRLAFPDAGMV